MENVRNILKEEKIHFVCVKSEWIEQILLYQLNTLTDNTLLEK